jgi:hypothetical protein
MAAEVLDIKQFNLTKFVFDYPSIEHEICFIDKIRVRLILYWTRKLLF